jgi:hypothetical protein
MEKYKVTLTVEERQALDRMVASGKAAAQKLVHARILLLGDEGPGGPRCFECRPLNHCSRSETVRDREFGVRHPSSAAASPTRQGQDPGRC